MTVGMVPFGQAARKALSLAHQEAVRLDHVKIGPGHILLGLIRDEGDVGKILNEQGANPNDVRRIVVSQTPASEKAGTQPGSVDLLHTTQRMLERAVEVTREKNHGSIDCEHLLLALVELEDGRTKDILAAAGLDRDTIREYINQRMHATQSLAELDELLDTLEASRRSLEAEFGTAHEERLRKIEAILREYFGQ